MSVHYNGPSVQLVQSGLASTLSAYHFAMSGAVGILVVLCLLLGLQVTYSSPHENGAGPLAVTDENWSSMLAPVDVSLISRRKLAEKKKKKKKKSSYKPRYVIPSRQGSLAAASGGGNAIDDCWMRNSDWRSNRMHLADCAIGFGADAAGGQGGRYYEVTDPGDHPTKPWPGTLRYGVSQLGPLWITFRKDMNIVLKAELMVTSYKTIDARGANVNIGFGGPCLTLQYVSHVIIHGLNLHDCQPGSPGYVITSTAHTGKRQGSDGDAISLFGSNNVWIDHCSLSRSADGLIDAIHGSTAITVSNNYFSDHDKVMLFGHSDSFTADKNMKVTVVYNHFVGCVQRMPRGRFGYFHVVNNNFESWQMYAIGGSANPTFFSEANRFVASANAKQVTKRESKGKKDWLWQSSGDMFVNGAYFVESGKGDCTPGYSRNQYFSARPASIVSRITANAGPLHV